MDHHVNLLLLDPGIADDSRGIRDHFVHIPTPSNGSGALFHTQYGNSHIGLDRFVGGYADQEMVPKSASLFEKLYMPIVESIGHHVYVYSCRCPSSKAFRRPITVRE